MGYAARRLALYALCTGLLCGPTCHGQGQAVAESGDKTLRSGTDEMSVRPPPASYDEFLTRARALHPGMTRAEIVIALGMPAEEGDKFMRYSLVNLAGFPGFPGPVGTQVFPGMSINLQSGRMSGPVGWASIDSTGIAPPLAPHPVPRVDTPR